MPTRLDLTLPSTPGSVDRVEETMLAQARLAGFDEDEAGGLALAAREAAINAIFHGNQQDAHKVCRATFDLTPERLTLTLIDEGAGFDPAMLADPTAPENLLRTSGRGVLLMRAYMDDVAFAALKRGTQVTLTRRRNTAAESSVAR